MANKGEWAEHYAFFKVLADKKLVALDKDKNLMNDLYYNVLEIVKNEKRYQILEQKINVVANNKVISSFDSSEFEEKAEQIKTEILSNLTASEILDEVLKFECQIGIEEMKASSKNKADIIIKVHDFNTNIDSKLAFSIKSQWGSSATLVNASKVTNFIYRVIGNLTENEIQNFNQLKTFDEKAEFLAQNNCSLQFENCSSETFEDNLTMIDSLMTTIIADLLLKFYVESYQKTGKRISNLSNLTALLSNEKLSQKHLIYKIKQYLFAVALGMNPAKEWLGRFEANGGYLIVKAKGEIGIYHLINLNEFQDYLFENTKLETASTNRHEFGKIYNENGVNKIRLNLQVRFTD